MKLVLTDRQYWLLTSFIERFGIDEVLQGSVRENAEHLLRSGTGSVALSVNEIERSILQDLVNSDIGSLNCKGRVNIGDAFAYSFYNDNNDAIHVFTYRSEHVMEALTQMMNGNSSTWHAVYQYMRDPSALARSCAVSGYALGGAVALYAAAAVDGSTGVVFDAPGIAELLEQQTVERAHMDVVNYVSYYGLLPAFGIQAGEVRYAQEPEYLLNVLDMNNPVHQLYRFDEKEAVAQGEAVEIFKLLEKLNVITEYRTSAMDTVIHAFCRVIEMEEVEIDHEGWLLMRLFDCLYPSQCSAALKEVASQHDVIVKDRLTYWSQEISQRVYLESIDEWEKSLNSIVEHAMQETADSVAQFYDAAEAVIGIAVLVHVEDPLYSATLETELQLFVDRLEEGIDRFAEQLDEVLEQVMEQRNTYPFQFSSFELEV